MAFICAVCIDDAYKEETAILALCTEWEKEPQGVSIVRTSIESFCY